MALTITLDYKLVKRPAPLEPIKGPYAKVVLTGPKERLNVIALVDSGADTCAIPRGIAEILGLKLGEKAEPVIGLGGEIAAYQARLDIVVEGTHEKHVLDNIPVNVLATKAGDDFPVILGREGFFEAFEITFKERAQKIILKKVSSSAF